MPQILVYLETKPSNPKEGDVAMMFGKDKYGDSEYYDVLFEEDRRSERFLPSIRAQAPKAKGETFYQKKSDGRKMSDNRRDRGRGECGEEKGRPGRQRSNSAESRKVPQFDGESNRAALRVSTSPSPHHHKNSKGDLAVLHCPADWGCVYSSCF